MVVVRAYHAQLPETACAAKFPELPTSHSLASTLPPPDGRQREDTPPGLLGISHYHMVQNIPIVLCSTLQTCPSAPCWFSASRDAGVGFSHRVCIVSASRIAVQILHSPLAYVSPQTNHHGLEEQRPPHLARDNGPIEALSVLDPRSSAGAPWPSLPPDLEVHRS